MNAAAQRRQEQQALRDAHRAELRRLQIAKKEQALELARKKKDSKIDILVAKELNTIQLNQLRNETAAARTLAENEALTSPLNAAAVIDASDAEARSKLVRALPWIIGGVVVIGGLYMLKRRSGR